MKKLLPIILLILLDAFFFFKPVHAATPIYEAEKTLINDIVLCYEQLEENPYCSKKVIADVKSFANEWGRLDNDSTIIILAGLQVNGESGLNAIENMIVLLSLAAMCDDVKEFRTSLLCDWADWTKKTSDLPHFIPDNG